LETSNEGHAAIDAYIAASPADVRKLLETMRATIHAAAPDAQEIISYSMPAFAQQGNLVYFSAAKQHIGFYPTPSAIKEFAQDLADYKSSKGAVQFPLDKPLPVDLITRMVQFRVNENMAKAAAKQRKPKAKA
jgi:uncharacterized protein YdhG (YjbR/CyaY superfamily)